MNFADWGKLVFFDTEEHEVTAEKSTLAHIPKLADQWKIIFDFKPTDYPTTRGSLHLVWMTSRNSDYTIGINFWRGTMFLEGNDSYGLRRDQLPKLFEWTRMEFSHEEEDGKYFIILSVGGKEVGRTVTEDFDFENLEDVKIHTGGGDWGQPGFMRGLLVLEKQ